MMEANLLTAWARLLLSSLADAGVRDVVLSPGSRSTPFVLAALREPRLRCQDVVDERAAAFFALGQARVTGRPSVLLCTSGSAGAHYLPALVEAAHAHLPVLALTADRPFELQHCQAAQTMEQPGLFAHHARACFDLGMPDGSPGALAALRRVATQAVHRTLLPLPGPVHLNARARKPLEPRAPASEPEVALTRRVDALLATPVATVSTPTLIPGGWDLRAPAAVLGSGPGLIVCGPLAHPDVSTAKRALDGVAALSQRYAAPVLCEAASGLRGGWSQDALVAGAFEPVLRAEAFTARHPPTWVLELGAPAVSGAWERFAGSVEGLVRIVATPHGWADPSSRARHLLQGPSIATLDALRAHAPASAPGNLGDRAAWCDAWRQAFALADEAVEGELRARAGLSELAVLRAVHRTLPADASLVLGNSLPLRHADLALPPRGALRRVFSQRGVNGIDGLVAGAVGAASCLEHPVVLVLGDLSLLHDLTSLGLAGRSDVPLVVVVIHNQGGRIFEQLPLAHAPGVKPEELAHMTTPHRVDFSHAARLFGVRYARCASVPALDLALARALGRPGPTLLEARVPPHDAVAQRDRIQRRFEASLRGKGYSPRS